jgi:hypothetical protein
LIGFIASLEKKLDLTTILFCLLLIKKQKVINSHCLLVITFFDFSFLKQRSIYIYTTAIIGKYILKLAS